jgi:alkylation response protein AidB-like acyl-CoA dehydrogenase
VDLKDTPEHAEYRARVRAWIEEHKHEAPPIDGSVLDGDPAVFRRWQRTLAQAKLVGVTWPQEYGGAGLGAVEGVIVNAELRRAGCAGILDHIAVGNIGPTIIAYGTDEQKDRWLGPMLHGDEGWCQLFSEPAAGSDLAGIQTRARRTDTGWVLNGQKVWTTLAQYADFGMLLARTDPEVPKHRGLTMFVVPMHADGVTVRPLRQVSGAAHFNEVFLDDVALGADALLGPVDGGWGVACATLMFERLAVMAAFEQFGWSAEQFIAPIADHPAIAQPHVRQRIAGIASDLLALRYSAYRMLTALTRGEVPSVEAGIGKISVINAGIAGAELIIELLGPDALDGMWGDLAAELLGLRAGGGTDEIIRNTIGERVLGLPPEPRFDKDRPFSELAGARREVAA